MIADSARARPGAARLLEPDRRASRRSGRSTRTGTSSRCSPAVVHIDPANHVIVGYKDLTENEFWVRGHMPGFPLLPGVLMCEAAAQLCGYYYATRRSATRACCSGSAGSTRPGSSATVRPGERLVMVGTGVKIHRRMTQVPRRRDRRRARRRSRRSSPAFRSASWRSCAVRKPRRLSPEELAPYQWQMPPRTGAGRRDSGVRRRAVDHGLLIARPCLLNDRLAATLRQRQPGRDRGRDGQGAVPAHLRDRPAGHQLLRHRDRPQVPALRDHAIRHPRNCPNVKTVCADARWVFRQFVPPGSVAAVHVYFPDPWWKARHKKRRVFTPGFAADAARVLREGGRLLIATDVEEYFGVMTGIVRAMPAFREVRVGDESRVSRGGGFPDQLRTKSPPEGNPRLAGRVRTHS